MTKLMIRYLKPFTWSVVAIIALLFVQAQTELAYMSEIVNTGIQTGGITSSLPEAIRASEYEKVKIFMDEDGITRMDDAYQLVTKENATMEQVESYPALSNEDVYTGRRYRRIGTRYGDSTAFGNEFGWYRKWRDIYTG